MGGDAVLGGKDGDPGFRSGGGGVGGRFVCFWEGARITGTGDIGVLISSCCRLGSWS